MRILVDTHVFIWLMSSPDRLAAAVRSVCEQPSTSLILGVVSLWEMQIKVGVGKRELHLPLRDLVREQVDQGPFELLPVVAEHVLELESLPPHHQDPFDRLLIAQARVESLRLASQDRKIVAYQPLIDLLS